MEEISRNGLNQATVRVADSSGARRTLKLGAAATRAIATFPPDARDAVLVAAADYASRNPLSDDGLLWDNHLAAVTGGANDVPAWRRDRGLPTAALPGPPGMPDGFDVLSRASAVIGDAGRVGSLAHGGARASARRRTGVSSRQPMNWHLRPGETIVRTELHARYGGSRQGGTVPSRTSPNVFLFLDRAAGAPHGYFDGWVGTHLYYTGHGQKGDQELKGGNAAVLRHRQDARAIRVFRGARGRVRYLGEFELADDPPYFRMEAPESGTGHPRQVIVFRLRPLGRVIHEPEDELQLPEGTSARDLDAVVARTSSPEISRVPVEQQHVEEVHVSRTTASYTASRREQSLVLEYSAYLERAGSVVSRFRMHPPGEARAIVCDLYDETRNNLIEAKGTGARGELRMAIGQLLDYARFQDARPALAVLLPSRPRPDLEALLKSADVHRPARARLAQYQYGKVVICHRTGSKKSPLSGSK